MQQYNHTYWLLLSLPRSLSWGLYQGLCQGVPIKVRFLCQVPWCLMECEIGVRVQRCNKNPRDSSCFLNFYMKNTLKILFLLITSLLEYKKSRQAESLWGILHHDMKSVLQFSPLDTFSDFWLMNVKVASTCTKMDPCGTNFQASAIKLATASSSLSSAWMFTLQTNSRLLVKGRKINLPQQLQPELSRGDRNVKSPLKWCNINSSWIATTVVRFCIAEDGRVIHLPFSVHAKNYIQYTHD